MPFFLRSPVPQPQSHLNDQARRLESAEYRRGSNQSGEGHEDQSRGAGRHADRFPDATTSADITRDGTPQPSTSLFLTATQQEPWESQPGDGTKAANLCDATSRPEFRQQEPPIVLPDETLTPNQARASKRSRVTSSLFHREAPSRWLKHNTLAMPLMTSGRPSQNTLAEEIPAPVRYLEPRLSSVEQLVEQLLPNPGGEDQFMGFPLSSADIWPGDFVNRRDNQQAGLSARGRPRHFGRHLQLAWQPLSCIWSLFSCKGTPH